MCKKFLKKIANQNHEKNNKDHFLSFFICNENLKYIFRKFTVIYILKISLKSIDIEIDIEKYKNCQIY